MRFSAVVLAGGRSRRMGRDKARLPLRTHPTLLARQLDVLCAVGPCERLVSCRAEQPLALPVGVRAVYDEGAAGPLGGLIATMRVMRTDALLVLGVDLARMHVTLLRRIVGAAQSTVGGQVGVVPRTALAPQPLAALWPRALLSRAEHQLAAGRDLALRTLVAQGMDAGLLRWFDVESFDAWQFANWNRPGDVA